MSLDSGGASFVQGVRRTGVPAYLTAVEEEKKRLAEIARRKRMADVARNIQQHQQTGKAFTPEQFSAAQDVGMTQSPKVLQPHDPAFYDRYGKIKEMREAGVISTQEAYQLGSGMVEQEEAAAAERKARDLFNTVVGKYGEKFWLNKNIPEKEFADIYEKLSIYNSQQPTRCYDTEWG